MTFSVGEINSKFQWRMKSIDIDEWVSTFTDYQTGVANNEIK